MVQELCKTLLGWSILLPGFYLAGTPLTRFLTEQDYRMRGIFYTALGIILFVLYLIAAGSLGQLNRTAVFLFFVPFFIWRRAYLADFGRWFSALVRYPWEGTGRLDRFLAVVFYASVILTFCFCLLPETANDALCYQLNVPKQFVWQGSIWPVTYDPNSYMPMAMNLLYAVGLLFDSIGITKLFHAGMGLLLTYTIAFKVEPLTGSARVARLAALMFWLAPVVVNEAAVTYVDLGVSFFLLLSFLWLQAAVSHEKKSLFFIAGLGAGITIAIKFSLLIAMPVLVLVGLGPWLRSFQFRKIISFAPFFLAGLFLGCGYWFTRNFILTGNPAFPYFGELFNTLSLTQYSTYLDIGVAKTPWNFILLPAYLTLHPVPFDHHFWAGPAALLSMPALIMSCRSKTARPYFFFTLLLGGAWFLTTQATRYLLPVLPFWAIAAGAGLPLLVSKVKSKIGLTILQAGLLGVTSIVLLAGAYHYRVQWNVLTGAWSFDTYLRKMERSYPAARWADQHLPQNARVLNVEEIRQFYFTRPTVREEFLELFTGYTQGRNPEEVLSFLKEQGFTHLMHVQRPGAGAELERLQWLDAALGRQALERLGSVDSEALREGRSTYTVYRIR